MYYSLNHLNWLLYVIEEITVIGKITKNCIYRIIRKISFVLVFSLVAVPECGQLRNNKIYFPIFIMIWWKLFCICHSFVGDHRIMLSLHYFVFFCFLLLLFPGPIPSSQHLPTPALDVLSSIILNNLLQIIEESGGKSITFLRLIIFFFFFLLVCELWRCRLYDLGFFQFEMKVFESMSHNLTHINHLNYVYKWYLRINTILLLSSA